MCGLWGFSEVTPITRVMAPLLAIYLEERGKDSWGASNGQEIIKHIGPVTESWELPAHWDGCQAIFHTRAKSVGDVKVENAHPFEFAGEGRHIIGVHNGCLSNYTELNTKYDRKFEVDSMHVFAHLAEGRDTKEIEGWGALAWFHNGNVRLARFNSDALKICRLETGEVVFASTLEPIKKAALMAGSRIKINYEVAPETMHFWTHDPDGWTLRVGEKLPFGVKVYRAAHASWEDDYSSYSNSWWSRRFASNHKTRPDKADHCWKCGTAEVDRKKALLCSACFVKVMEKLGEDVNGTACGIN